MTFFSYSRLLQLCIMVTITYYDCRDIWRSVSSELERECNFSWSRFLPITGQQWPGQFNGDGHGGHGLSSPGGNRGWQQRRRWPGNSETTAEVCYIWKLITTYQASDDWLSLWLTDRFLSLDLHNWLIDSLTEGLIVTLIDGLVIDMWWYLWYMTSEWLVYLQCDMDSRG